MVGLVFIVLAGCAPETKTTLATDPVRGSYNEEDLLAIGKKALTQFDYDTGSKVYQRILNEVNPESNEAKFGYVLSSVQYLVYFVEAIVNQLGKVTGNGTGSDTSDLPLSKVIQYVVDTGLVQENITQRQLLKEIIWSDPNFTFTVEKFPLKFKGKTLVEMGGEFDIADVHFFMGVLHLLHGVEEIVTGLNIDMRTKAVAADFKSSQSILLAAQSWIQDMLGNAMPAEFLTLSEEKLKNIAVSGEDFGLALREIKKAIEISRNEADDQLNDVLVVREGKVRFTPKREITLPDGIVDGLLAVMDNMVNALLDETEYDANLGTLQQFDVASFNELIQKIFYELRNQEYYGKKLGWFAVNLFANWIQDNKFAGFHHGCIEWDLRGKFLNPSQEGLRKYLAMLLNSDILKYGSEVEKLIRSSDEISSDSLDLFSNEFKSGLEQIITNGRNIFDQFMECSWNGLDSNAMVMDDSSDAAAEELSAAE
jgi:hypothetical protein